MGCVGDKHKIIGSRVQVACQTGTRLQKQFISPASEKLDRLALQLYLPTLVSFENRAWCGAKRPMI
jgi:hypothetical protein